MIKRIIKKIYYNLSPNYIHLRRDINIPYKWHGSNYGGFYLFEKPLGSNSVVYSLGIGKDVSFDISLIKKFSCKVYAFDPTPDSIHWVIQQKFDERFIFFDYGISRKAGIVKLHLPKNEDHVSGSILNNSFVSKERFVKVNMKNICDAMDENGHDQIDVLKMDIEGAEYEVLSDLIIRRVKVNQILVEIHDRFFSKGFEKSKKVFAELRDAGFLLYAISDSFEEISFVHKSIL